MARPATLLSARFARACDVASRRVRPGQSGALGQSSRPPGCPPLSRRVHTGKYRPPPPLSGQSHGHENPSPSPPNSNSTSGLWLFLSLLPAAGFFYSACFSIGTVGGGSMTPTLNPDFTRLGISAPQDWVILNRAAASTQSWKVGDIVVLISPLNPNHLYTKRLIGLPGDVVRYQKKRRMQTGPNTYRQVTEWARVKLPRGYCWVESDSSVVSQSDSNRNSDLSRDSRHFGPIPMGLLTARVSFIIWPLNRIGWPSARPGLEPKPGQPGLERGWWPFGGDVSDDDDAAKKKVDHDSPLTPFVQDDQSATARKPRFVDSVDVVVGQDEDDVSGSVYTKKKKVLNKNVPMDEMDPKEREKVVDFLNSLSRGGSLGHFDGNDKDASRIETTPR